MALILSIDTTTTVCSVALHNKGKLVLLKELHLDKSHAEHLVPIINDVLATSGATTDTLNGIAFSKGPGSYTGLRIGSSTVKGLCYAHNIPLIAIDTLKAMAHQIKSPLTKQTLLCPMIDARRMEVYAALYNQHYEPVMEVQPVIIDENSFHVYLKEHQIVFFGNGAAKCKSVLSNNAIYIDAIEASAATMGKLAYSKFQNKEFENTAYFEPFYLKEFKPTTPKVKLF